MQKKTLSTIAALAAAGIALTGCASDTDTPDASSSASAASDAPAHWTYEGEDGPAYWGELSSDYETCETGEEQSPIDLDSSSPADEDELSLEYGEISEHVVDTGHTAQLVADDEASVEYEGTAYSLVQMHFHGPSEHTIDGEPAPVEFHFVHSDADDNLLVVGVLATEGAENAAYSEFIDATASGADDEVAGSADLTAMVPADLGHFAYLGSLTTPPCTENVQWIVLQTPIELGAAQIETLDEAYGPNNRPVQPLNDREVSLTKTTVSE